MLKSLKKSRAPSKNVKGLKEGSTLYLGASVLDKALSRPHRFSDMLLATDWVKYRIVGAYTALWVVEEVLSKEERALICQPRTVDICKVRCCTQDENALGDNQDAIEWFYAPSEFKLAKKREDLLNLILDKEDHELSKVAGYSDMISKTVDFICETKFG